MTRNGKASLALAAVLAAVAITASTHTVGALYAQSYGDARPAATAIANLAGKWQITLIGNTGCGFTSMLVNVTLNAAGSGTATSEGHSSGCPNGTVGGLPFVIQTMNPNGSGTANLSCGAGCGWEFNIQVAPNHQVFNLVDVYAQNPGNFLEGTAIRQ